MDISFNSSWFKISFQAGALLKLTMCTTYNIEQDRS